MNTIAPQVKKVVIASLALILAAGIGYLAAGKFSSQGKYVEVKGLSERIVKADTAIWPINIEARSNNIDSLYQEIERNIGIVEEFLLDQGFTEEEINVAPINVYQDTYQGAQYRYNANVQMSVYTDKVDLVRSASEQTLDLIRRGVVISGNYIDFQFNDLNSIKTDMLAEAIENARVSAEQFATDSGTRLKGIARANQGVFSITQKDPGSPEYKNVRIVSTLRYLLK